ncbi:MAG: autotransporter domain-containing protein [Planctomycetaceae bacterium]|nr:autotransporter domain-containing protein [Planctomycetaceae bacterium]
MAVTDDENRLTSTLENTVVSWNGTAGQPGWNVTDENWTDTGGPSAFLHGDVVNFNAGVGDVAIQDNGVVVAGMYVSGTQDYTFTGGPIIAEADSTLTGDAVSGKLVLGGTATEAAGVATAADADYTGVVDLTGITGANQFANGVDIRGGTLVIANAGQLGTGLANLSFIDSALGKTLRGTGDLVFDGAGGAGQRLVVDTRATIDMVGDSSFTIANSVTTTDGAAISVGVGGDLSLDSVDGNYTYTNNRATGNGGAIANAGTLTINSGVFQNNQAGGQGGAIYNAGDLTLSGGGSFSGNQAGGTSNAIFMDAGSGAVSLVVETAADETMDMRDALAGSGSDAITIDKTGDGTWLLGGTSEFGGTDSTFTVGAGTLHLYGGGEADGVAAGHINGLANFVLGTGATLEVGGNNSILATNTGFDAGSRIVAGSGDNGITSLTVDTAVLGDGVEFNAAAGRILSLNGTLSGGTLNKTGAGELILAQTGHILNALNVQDGILGLVVDSATGDPSVIANSVTFDPDAMVNVSGFNGQTYGDRVVLVQSASGITGFTPGNYLIGGQTSVDFLTAQVTVEGNDLVAVVDLAWFDPTENASGTFTLNSDEFYLGANLDDRTNLADDWDGRTLTKRGAGALILTGNNSYSGDTIINEGTLAITNVTGTGLNSATAGDVYIAPGANLQLAIDAANSGSYAKTVTGSGNLIKTGDGRVELDGDNAYTGLTVVREGTLAATTLGSVGPNRGDQQVIIDAGATFELATDEDGNFNQTLSGTGEMAKTGSGDITLTADNRNFLGTLSIADGSVTANHDTALGSGTINNNADLALNYSGVFANALTGTGTTTTNGTLTFTGDHSTYTGDTIVSSGRVNLQDGFVSGSDFVVQSGATLTGCATVGGLTVQGGGILSPGRNLEQFRVTGDATFEEGSTYIVTIAGGSNASDTLHVGGNTTIEAGARLNIFLADNSSYGPVGDSREYLIVDSGSFTDNTVFDFGLRNRIGYDLDQDLRSGGLYLVTTSRLPDFAGIAGSVGTPNAIRAGEALDRLVGSGAAGGLGTLFDTLLNLPADAAVAADALSQLHGEVFAAGQDASIRMQRGFVNASRAARTRAVDALAACRPGASVQRPYTVWATASNSWFDRRGKGGYSGFDLESHGFAIGMDRSFSQTVFGGIAFGYDSATQRFDSIRSRAEYDVFHAMVYGGYHNDNWRVDGYLGYGKTWHETRRQISIGEPGMAFSSSPTAKYNDNLFAVGVDVGRNIALCPVVLTPSVGLHYTHLRTPSIAERDGYEANLRASGSNADTLRLPVGVTAAMEYVVDDVRIRPQVRAFYLAELADGDATSQTRFAAAPQYDFRAKSGKWGRHTGRFGAGLEAEVRDRVSVRVDYDFEVGSRVRAHELMFNVAVRW